MLLQVRRSLGVALLAVLALAQESWALGLGGTGAYPWETAIAKIVASLQGPVVSACAVGSIILFGICWSMSEGRVLGWAIGILFGLSVAAGATSIAQTFFGFTAGGAW